jgi:hypothetical protein
MTTLRPMKWSATGASLIASKPRDGATVRGLEDPPVTHRRGAVHIHVHGYRTADQATPLRSAAARRDQTTEPQEAGFKDRGVVLRGRDQEGRNWAARIYGPGGAGYSEEDPDKIFTSTGDANAGGPGELEAGKAFEERMARAISPSGKAADRGPASLRGYARLLEEHYRRR